MIKVKRDGTCVNVAVETDLPNAKVGKETEFSFTYDCGDGRTEEAELLTRYLRKRLDDCAKHMRRQAYAQGWKDKAAKKHAKATQFSTSFIAGGEWSGCWR